MSGKLVLSQRKLILTEDIECIFLKEIVPIGNGAHVLCPKEHVGKTAYLVVVKK
jgi:putative transposon-encoded protein